MANNELERMKNRLRDLAFLTAGLLFEAPPHLGVDVEDYLQRAFDNILHDKPLPKDTIPAVPLLGADIRGLGRLQRLGSSTPALRMVRGAIAINV